MNFEIAAGAGSHLKSVLPVFSVPSSFQLFQFGQNENVLSVNIQKCLSVPHTFSARLRSDVRTIERLLRPIVFSGLSGSEPTVGKKRSLASSNSQDHAARIGRGLKAFPNQTTEFNAASKKCADVRRKESKWQFRGGTSRDHNILTLNSRAFRYGWLLSQSPKANNSQYFTYQ